MWQWLVGVVVLFCIVVSVIFSLPYWLVDFVHWLLRPNRSSHGVLFRVIPKSKDKKKRIALTIDDAPHSKLTPVLLDILKKNDCHATFFCIGSYINQVDSSLLDRMRDEGHELANHLMKDQASIKLPIKDFEKELLEVDKLIQPRGGWREGQIKWFRPGSGFCSPRMVEQVEKLGYRVALGNCYPFDPHLRNAAICKWYIKAKAAPGSVIILHDGSEKRRYTADTLEEVLPYLRKNGFEVVTLSELVETACE